MVDNIEYRILFAEDVSTDREIVERILKQNGIKFISECVDTEPEFKEMLVAFNPHLILSDYQMPTFNGMRALEIAKQLKPEVPFVVITGSTNEDIAVQCMKNGADDYVIKQNLKRLIPAIQSAFEKKKSQLAEKKALKRLQDSEFKYRSLVENSDDAIFLIYENSFKYINEKFADLFEIDIETLNSPGFNWFSLVHPECLEEVQKRIEKVEPLAGNSDSFELRMRSTSGKDMYIDMFFSYFSYKDGIAKQGVLRDVSDKKELKQRNSMLSKVVEQSPLSIVITKPNADIEYVNPFFEKSSGYSLAEAKGKNPRILKSNEHSQQFYSEMWGQLMAGNVWLGEIKNKKKDGTFYWENVCISPIYSEHGKLEHYVAIKEDISELKKYINELKTAKEKAEESDQLKTAFLANMSHEIRTPMNGIMGFTEILKEDGLSQNEKNEYINIIQKSGERMLNTITDLVSISKIESGLVDVHPKKIQVSAILNDIYLILNNEAENKGLAFVNSKCKEELRLYTDEEKLFVILTNIVKNAIKFTLSGKVSIACSSSENEIIFTVADTGIGIPEARKDAVFERFVQADIRDSKVFEGSGLGLSIAKSYVELLKGKIWFESQENRGTTFYVSLPNYTNEINTLPDTNNASNDEKDIDIEKLNILIVEDDEITMLLIKKIVGDISTKFHAVDNGSDAIDFMRREKDIDLILMDIKLSKIDGFEASRQIRAFNKDVKIIAQTAFAHEADSLMAFEAGCDNYITKPFTKSEMLTCIHETMEVSI